MYGSYLLQAHAGLLATLASPSIATEYRSRLDLSGVLAVALSQSGQTEEIVETLAWARGLRRARRWPSPTAPAPRWPGWPTWPWSREAGTERAVPATKTFTTQLAALAVLAIGLGADLDPGQLRSVPDEIERMLATGLAGRWSRSWPTWRGPGVVVSGRGLAYAAALELALKLKEACYLHAMGLSYADLLHGPIAVVDARTPAILLAADSGPDPGGHDRAGPPGRRGRGPGLRRSAAARGWPPRARRALPGPPLPEWLAPMGLIVPGQLLTEALSRRLGHRPGQPARAEQGHPDRLMTGPCYRGRLRPGRHADRQRGAQPGSWLHVFGTLGLPA